VQDPRSFGHAAGVFVVFDFSNTQSFQYIKEHTNMIKEKLFSIRNIMLLGIDHGEKNIITSEEADALASEFRTEYKRVLLSSVTSTEDVFHTMANSLINSLLPTQNEETNNDHVDSSPNTKCLVM
jgi:hypothetical protein